MHMFTLECGGSKLFAPIFERYRILFVNHHRPTDAFDSKRQKFGRKRHDPHTGAMVGSRDQFQQIIPPLNDSLI